MRCLGFAAKLAAALAGLVSIHDASATVLCVDTSAELHSALNYWALQGQDLETVAVRVVKGTYAFQPANPYIALRDATLRLSGGWSPGCASRSIDPESTVLDAANSGSSLN